MKKIKRLTKKMAIELIEEKLDLSSLGTIHIRAILENVIPFSWHVCCKVNKINPNILMDEHEKRCRRDKRLTSNKSSKKVRK